MYITSAAGSSGTTAINLSVYRPIPLVSHSTLHTVQPTATHLVIQCPTPSIFNSYTLSAVMSPLSQAQSLTSSLCGCRHKEIAVERRLWGLCGGKVTLKSLLRREVPVNNTAPAAMRKSCCDAVLLTSCDAQR